VSILRTALSDNHLTSRIAIKRIMEDEGMELEIIVNPKTNDDGVAVIQVGFLTHLPTADSHPLSQLETAAGAAIKHFRNAHGLNVPRSRFLPVKSCSDLLLIKSDIYSISHGQLQMNEARMFDTIPVIKLSDHFKKIQQFQKRFKKIPKIVELDHLTVTGDVYFGRNVTLRGTVIGVYASNLYEEDSLTDGHIFQSLPTRVSASISPTGVFSRTVSCRVTSTLL
jgi:UTP--glucose-1-phosphate uridylyltransferase